MQFRESELGELFEKFLIRFKRKKFAYSLFIIFAIVYFSIPSFNIPVLEYQEFRFTSLMEQRAIEKKLNFLPKQKWVDIDEINPNLLKAIISMEDGNFFHHKGIDWKELRQSLNLNKRKKKIARGGSTITMQLSKNLYLSTDRNFFRKAKEFVIAMRMEKEISKKTILENYVNAIEWGNGIFGINKASEIYFEKEPENLTINESSKLAAVIPSPLKNSPTDNSRYVKRRSAIIRSRLNDVIIPAKN